MQSRAAKLRSIGQSLWLDYLDRSLIETGDLARRIAEDGLAGVTTNPSIFEAAIGGAGVYDGQIERLGRQGLGPAEIAERIMLEDVRRAADLLREVHERTGGLDGYVSLEVRPSLAHDLEGTCAEAKRLFAALDRPNVMIKIPSTPEGFVAIRRSIEAGLNINATLIFSADHYQGVANAYLDGLAARAARGEPVSGIASVASAFVSRVDSAVDKVLDERAKDPSRAAAAKRLRGRAAVANARAVYGRFRETFRGEAFGRLRAAGASLQRLLWGSTGTKDPAYPDTKYVDDLGAPDTVNTVPLATFEAFLDHGTPRDALSGDPETDRAVLRELGALGIDLDGVCRDLQEKGVQSFAKSYDGLLATLQKRRESLVSR